MVEKLKNLFDNVEVVQKISLDGFINEGDAKGLPNETYVLIKQESGRFVFFNQKRKDDYSAPNVLTMAEALMGRDGFKHNWFRFNNLKDRTSHFIEFSDDEIKRAYSVKDLTSNGYDFRDSSDDTRTIYIIKKESYMQIMEIFNKILHNAPLNIKINRP